MLDAAYETYVNNPRASFATVSRVAVVKVAAQDRHLTNERGANALPVAREALIVK
jgi:hypothetical protein